VSTSGRMLATKSSVVHSGPHPSVRAPFEVQIELLLISYCQSQSTTTSSCVMNIQIDISLINPIKVY
jgi:hypothetical protein